MLRGAACDMPESRKTSSVGESGEDRGFFEPHKAGKDCKKCNCPEKPPGYGFLQRVYAFSIAV